jgi:hypothetical protein
MNKAYDAQRQRPLARSIIVLWPSHTAFCEASTWPMSEGTRDLWDTLYCVVQRRDPVVVVGGRGRAANDSDPCSCSWLRHIVKFVHQNRPRQSPRARTS